MSAIIDTATHEALTRLRRELAGVQPAEGTQVDVNTWCWIQGYLDFDYEHAYLVEVRTARVTTDGFDSEYLAIFEGFDNHGQSLFVMSRFDVGRHPALADALLWWVRWVTRTRETRMVETEPETVSAPEVKYQMGHYYKGVYTPGKRIDG